MSIKNIKLKNRNRETLEQIELRYSNIIGKAIENMSNRTMAELWLVLETIKSRMRKDIARAGIKLECN